MAFARSTAIDPAELDTKFDEQDYAREQLAGQVASIASAMADINAIGGVLQANKVGPFTIDGQTYATLDLALGYLATKGGTPSVTAPTFTTPYTTNGPYLSTATTWDVDETITYHEPTVATGSVTTYDAQLWVNGLLVQTWADIQDAATFAVPNAAADSSMWMVVFANWAATPPVQLTTAIYTIGAPAAPVNATAPSVAPTSVTAGETITATRGSYTVNGQAVNNSELTFTQRFTAEWTTTGSFSGGETSGTLSANWGGTTAAYTVIFSNGDERSVTLTQDAATMSWTGGLSGAATTAVEVVVYTASTSVATNTNNIGHTLHYYETPTGAGGAGSETESSTTVTVTAAPASFPAGHRAITATPTAQFNKFASPAGSGNGLSYGSPGALSTMLSGLVAGDKLALLAGTYTRTSQTVISATGTSGSPIIIENYPGETATITMPSPPTVDHHTWAHTGSYIKTRGLVFDTCNSKRVVTILGSNITVEGCEIKNSPGLGIETQSGSSNAIIRDNHVHDLSNVGWDGVSNPLIQSGDGGWPDGVQINGGNGHLVEYNSCHDISDEGIDAWSGTNYTIRRNVVYNCGAGTGGVGNGIKYSGPGSSGGLCEYNFCWSNRASGFNNNTGPITYVQYNTAWNNGYNGFRLGDGDTGTVRWNNALSNTSGNFNVQSPGVKTGNSDSIGGTLAFQSTTYPGATFLKPTVDGGFEAIGAWA